MNEPVQVEPLPGKEAKPCPFCGGASNPFRLLRDGCLPGEPEAYAYFLTCNSCAADGGWAKTLSGAYRNWNMRV